MKYKILRSVAIGEGNSAVHYLGLGAEIELDEDEAAPLVEAGRLEPVDDGDLDAYVDVPLIETVAGAGDGDYEDDEDA